MFASGTAGHGSDRFGPQCAEVPGGSVEVTLPQVFPAAISAERLADRQRIGSDRVQSPECSRGSVARFHARVSRPRGGSGNTQATTWNARRPGGLLFEIRVGECARPSVGAEKKPMARAANTVPGRAEEIVPSSPPGVFYPGNGDVTQTKRHPENQGRFSGMRSGSSDRSTTTIRVRGRGGEATALASGFRRYLFASLAPDSSWAVSRRARTATPLAP